MDNAPICTDCGVEMERYYEALDTGKDGYQCPNCGWSEDIDQDKPKRGRSAKPLPTVTYTTTKRLRPSKANRRLFLAHVNPKMALHFMNVGEAEGMTAEEFTLLLADMLQSQIRFITKGKA